MALVCPADTVTLDGTVATDVLLLVRVIVAPPEGAAALRVTVPVELFPPLTLVGFKVSEERVTLPAGVMLREACTELEPRVAVMTAVVVVVTDVVVTVNEVLVAPAATVTLLGQRDLWIGRRAAHKRRARGLLGSGPPRHARRSHGRSEIRVGEVGLCARSIGCSRFPLRLRSLLGEGAGGPGIG